MVSEKFVKVIFLSAVVFLLSGCQQINFNDSMKALDVSLGKTFSDWQSDQASSTLNLFSKKFSSNSDEKTLTDLSNTDKKAIDNWLEKKGLNKYGDAKNAIYTGGTPLFDEKSGQPVERYSYILNKFPDILNLIKQGK